MAKATDNVPVIVAVAQFANKDDERIEPAVALAKEAAERAAASHPVLLDRLITKGAVYSPPASIFAERDLADELGDALQVRGPRTSSGFSGASPLTLLAQACEAVRDGTAEVALVAGAVAEASVRRARALGRDVGPQAAPWSQGSGARREIGDDPRYRRPPSPESAAGVRGPNEIFALLESAMAHEAGRDFEAQRAWLGELMAPFTAVAATRPDVAWFPIERTAAELSAITPDNRLVVEPYTKRMNSFPTVDLAAAVFVTTDATADALGIAEDARVYPWGTGHGTEVAPPSGRPVFHRSRALDEAIRSALRIAQVHADDLTAFDVYSCFPAAVQMSMQALGLAPNDPRGLTLTGGLPYFGGPGANYVTHGIVSAVERCRGAAHERALVVGVGGAPSDFAATVFSASRPEHAWRIDRHDELAAELEAERVSCTSEREGVAVVEAMTVVHDRDEGPVGAPVVARFADGVRTGARADNPAMVRALAGRSLVGRPVRIRLRDGRPVYDAE